MSEFPEELTAVSSADKVAPMMLALCHESSEATGGLFEAGAGWANQWRWERTPGVFFSKKYTAEDVRDRMPQIMDFSQTNEYPTDLLETVSRVFNLWEGLQANPTNTVNINDAKTVLGFMKTYFDSGAELPLKEKVTYHWEIKTEAGVEEYTIAIDNGKGSVAAGKQGKGDATFVLTEADFIKVVTGAINPQVAFLQGKMKIKGNLGKATKFTPQLFPAPTAETLAKYTPSKL